MGYKSKVEEKMDSSAVQMSCGRNWSSRERYEMSLRHLNEAAEETLTLSRAGFFGAPVGRGGGGGTKCPLVKTLFPFSESTQVKFF